MRDHGVAEEAQRTHHLHVVDGSELLRQWVDDAVAMPNDLDSITVPDEESWQEERHGVMGDA